MAVFRFRVTDLTGPMAGFRDEPMARTFAESHSRASKCVVMVFEHPHGRGKTGVRMVAAYNAGTAM